MFAGFDLVRKLPSSTFSNKSHFPKSCFASLHRWITSDFSVKQFLWNLAKSLVHYISYFSSFTSAETPFMAFLIKFIFSTTTLDMEIFRKVYRVGTAHITPDTFNAWVNFYPVRMLPQNNWNYYHNIYIYIFETAISWDINKCLWLPIYSMPKNVLYLACCCVLPHTIISSFAVQFAAHKSFTDYWKMHSGCSLNFLSWSFLTYSHTTLITWYPVRLANVGSGEYTLWRWHRIAEGAYDDVMA